MQGLLLLRKDFAQIQNKIYIKKKKKEFCSPNLYIPAEVTPPPKLEAVYKTCAQTSNLKSVNGIFLPN